MSVTTRQDIYLMERFKGLFPGWGAKQTVVIKYQDGKLMSIADTQSIAYKSNLENSTYTIERDSHRRDTGLNVWLSVPIAGCDLIGSCLYTAGGCTLRSGKLSPLGLFLVTFMLYHFRKVYSEIVTAIPNNGGCYNALLNTAPKLFAGLAGCLSVLSYTATALVSAYDSIVYLSVLWPDVDFRTFTILILAIFAGLTILGVKESAVTSLVMFSLHFAMLTIFIIWCIIYGFQDDFKIFKENADRPFPDVYSTAGELLSSNNAVAAIFFGYSSALLGITGFETAANYVEEMKDNHVYVSTLNWLWVFAGVFNPVIGLVVMFVMPLDKLYESSSDMLAQVGHELGGKAFQNFICADAFIVLCGGTVTAYVGVVGLIRRLAQDKILPSFLLATNCRGTQHWAVLVFFALCSTLFLAIYNPNDGSGIENFAGVFAIAFLIVMLLFACSCMALKLERPFMARLVVAKWWQVWICVISVLIGLIGNILLAPTILKWFALYALCFFSVVFFMFQRVNLLRLGIWVVKSWYTDSESAAELKSAVKEAHERQEKYARMNYPEVTRNESISIISTQQLEMIVREEVTDESNQETIDKKPVDTEEINNLGIVLAQPIAGKMLKSMLKNLDEIVRDPIVFFAKTDDPICLHEAVDYVQKNELTQNLIVVHVVDYRRIMRVYDNVDSSMNQGEINQQIISQFVDQLNSDSKFGIESTFSTLPEDAANLAYNTSMLDTFYTFIRISTLVVRGSYFCPATVLWLSKYLNISTGSMLMGMPDTDFRYPIAEFKGVRVILRPGTEHMRDKTRNRLEQLLINWIYLKKRQGVDLDKLNASRDEYADDEENGLIPPHEGETL